MNAKNLLAFYRILLLLLLGVMGTAVQGAPLSSSALTPSQLLVQAKGLTAANYRLEILRLKQQLIGVIEQQRRECQQTTPLTAQKTCWSKLQLFERQIRSLLLSARNQYIRQIQVNLERHLAQSEKEAQQHPNAYEAALAPRPALATKK